MRSSAKQVREFPALFMTMLFIGASLSSIGCLRLMTQQVEASSDLAQPFSGYAGDTVTQTSGSFPGPEIQLSSEVSASRRLTQSR